MSEGILFENDGSLYCEIVGVSEQQYNKKIELSNEVPYETFEQSGKAIIIDNYIQGDETILIKLPASVKYSGRYDEYVNFTGGELEIFARSRYKNWPDQNKISVIVPDKVFEDRFDYTTVMYKINAKNENDC